MNLGILREQLVKEDATALPGDQWRRIDKIDDLDGGVGWGVETDHHILAMEVVLHLVLPSLDLKLDAYDILEGLLWKLQVMDGIEPAVDRAVPADLEA